MWQQRLSDKKPLKNIRFSSSCAKASHCAHYGALLVFDGDHNHDSPDRVVSSAGCFRNGQNFYSPLEKE